MQLDDFFGDGESEAGAFSGFLGGEEGVEDFVEEFFRDAAAGVPDEELDAVVVVEGFFPIAGTGFEGVAGGGQEGEGEGEFAGALHGVHGIDDEIDDDLLDADLID